MYLSHIKKKLSLSHLRIHDPKTSNKMFPFSIQNLLSDLLLAMLLKKKKENKIY